MRPMLPKKKVQKFEDILKLLEKRAETEEKQTVEELRAKYLQCVTLITTKDT